MGKDNKVLADITNEVWQNPNAFEKFEVKLKTYKKPQDCSDLIVKKINNEIWQEQINV